jgi:transcription-repair coupling factor (superfamily II helicase)
MIGLKEKNYGIAANYPYPISFQSQKEETGIKVRLRLLSMEDIFKAIIKLLSMLEEYISNLMVSG